MDPTPREPDVGDEMPDDLRNLLAALQHAHGGGDPAVILDLTRRLRAVAHRELPATSPLRRSIDSEDLMQETVVDLVRAVGEFRGHTWGRFFAFTHKLLQRRKTTHARRAKVRRAERDGDATASQLRDLNATSPSTSLAQREDAQKAAGLLRELASPYREALELRLQGVPTDAIARQLRATEATVRKRIARALAMLKAKW